MLTRAQWQTCKRTIVDRYATPSNSRGVLQFLSVIVPLAGLWFAIAQAPSGALWLVVLETLCLSLVLLRGFVLMHDCGHYSLFRTRWLNRVGGSCWACWPACRNPCGPRTIATTTSPTATGRSTAARSTSPASPTTSR